MQIARSCLSWTPVVTAFRLSIAQPFPSGFLVRRAAGMERGLGEESRHRKNLTLCFKVQTFYFVVLLLRATCFAKHFKSSLKPRALGRYWTLRKGLVNVYPAAGGVRHCLNRKLLVSPYIARKYEKVLSKNIILEVICCLRRVNRPCNLKTNCALLVGVGGGNNE